MLDTTFPHDKPQMLYWNVQSEIDGEATIQITYFTSGITWTADYLCIADAAEKQMSFEGFVRVHNNSGEEYENAQVRLVVGTINLVEKIAQLANIPITQVADLADRRDARLSQQGGAGRNGPRNARVPAAAMPDATCAEGNHQGRAQRILHLHDRRHRDDPQRLVEADAVARSPAVAVQDPVPLSPAEYGDQLVRMYLLTNDKESKLGTTPLPDGVVRVFRDNGRDGLSYLTQQTIKYIPIGDKIELNLGPDPEVIFELIKLRSFRDNLWLQIHGTSEFRKIGGDGVMSRSKTPRSPAGTTTKSTRSGFATTPPSRSTWKSAARCQGTSCSAASWSPSCTTTRPWSSPPR